VSQATGGRIGLSHSLTRFPKGGGGAGGEGGGGEGSEGGLRGGLRLRQQGGEGDSRQEWDHSVGSGCKQLAICCETD